MNTRRIPVSDGELQIFQAGKGDAVLFVHGWSLDHRAFQPQFDALQNQYQVINFDRRGFGQSSAPADLRREVDDISRILDALKIDKTHLVGMSQGGRIAIRFATRNAERLRSLSLQGTAADEIVVNDTPEERIPLDDYVSLVRNGRLSEVVSHWLAHPMMCCHGDLSVQQQLEDMLASYQGADLLQYDAESYAWPNGILEMLRELTLPVLLLTGQKDSAARQQIASKLLDLLPSGREHMFADAGHLCNLTAVEEFNRVLTDFLQSVS